MASKLATVISEPYERDANKNEQLRFWRVQLDRLAEKKMSWEELFAQAPEDLFSLAEHPLLEAVTTRAGDNLLHIAVLHSADEWIAQLAKLSILRTRRNAFGLTPFETANYLDRKSSAELIHAVPQITFSHQPNVEIEETGRGADLKILDYLAQPVYESDEVLEQILIRTNRAKSADLIEPEKIWMGIYFDKEIQQSLHPKVAIRWIDDEIGYGVYAAQRIPSCGFVGEYTGVVQERRPKHLKDNYYCVRYTTWETGRKKFVLDAEKRGNFTRFINHSSNPNLGLQSVYWRGLPRMIFISLKEIPEGSQLTFDYGNFFWKECQQIPKAF